MNNEVVASLYHCIIVSLYHCIIYKRDFFLLNSPKFELTRSYIIHSPLDVCAG